jgi:hypothetical protein
MWDTISPDSPVVELNVQAMRLQARKLRLARVRPFGFAPGSAHPTPPGIVDVNGPGTLSSGLANVLGFRAAVWSMSISYGDVADRAAPAAMVYSDFHHQSHEARNLEETMLGVASRWRDQATAPGGVAAAAGIGEGQGSAGPTGLTSARCEVSISGVRRQVPLLRLAEFSAWQSSHDKVLVTVVARHMDAEFPELVRLADLEPMIQPLEHPDRNAIAAAYTAMRNRHTEQMRHPGR